VQSVPGLEIIESCLTCNLRAGRLFCDLPADVLASLEEIRRTSVIPGDSVIFYEGAEARGIYVLCSGKAKLSANSRDGKTIILKIAEAGEVLGLSATVSAKPYEITAEALEPCRLNFIARRDFVGFLHKHGEACLRVAKLLSNSYQSAYEEIRSLGLSNSVAQRLAKLLLERSTKESAGKEPALKVHLPFSHEEIAQMIGTSRETVTRTLNDFKRKRLIASKGATIMIPDRKALADLVNS
jgi:CRP/FNR family transcriptional regulator, cyclic AMP receptor protein